ncbi:MAG: hypothetical protein APF83_14150 [Lutibacter sp. BRH_c52]|nr:MAG: hypothetical protein APF83_14150 [Lutibacter sp. BRH_c52]
MKYRTLGYFSQQLIDPMYEVFEVLDNNEHSEYENLMQDIKDINSKDLISFVHQHQIEHLLNKNNDIEIEKRSFYLIFHLQREITNSRIETLLQNNGLVNLFKSRKTSKLNCDKNYLIYTNQFDLKYHRFQIDDFVYELCPINGASNSNYWISRAILKCINETKVNFKVRLNPFIEIQSDKYFPIMYKMYVHGKPLNWKNLITLRNDDFGQWFNEWENNFTDFVWSPKENEIHFTCEEYPSYSFNGITTSRYFHAIFNKVTGGIKHCDGAIRVYNDTEIDTRKNYHVRQPEVRKVGKRLKIFQFDSKDNQNLELTQDHFSELAVNFFVWNHDVQRYFNI